MINKVTILGRLGADPDIRTMNSGDKVANLNIAVSESWKDKTTGEKKEKTEWVKCVVFGDGLVNVLEKYAHKGGRLYVEGKFTTRSWEQDGVKKYTTEVVVQGFGGTVQIIDWPDTGSVNQSDPQGGLGELEDSIPFASHLSDILA